VYSAGSRLAARARPPRRARRERSDSESTASLQRCPPPPLGQCGSAVPNWFGLLSLCCAGQGPRAGPGTRRRKPHSSPNFYLCAQHDSTALVGFIRADPLDSVAGGSPAPGPALR
jgi:hypothetical protein